MILNRTHNGEISKLKKPSPWNILKNVTCSKWSNMTNIPRYSVKLSSDIHHGGCETMELKLGEIALYTLLLFIV